MRTNLQSRWSLRAAALAVGALGLATSSHALEGYSTWDNFDSASQIDETRWLFLERGRAVEGGKLRFIQRDLGSQYANGGLFSNSWGENLANPWSITQMKAAVTVGAFDLTGCATNPTDASSVQARIVGGFFNAGPGVPTSRVNDVGAVIRLTRASNSVDPAGVLRVQGTVFQCTTSDCNYSSTDLGTVELGTAAVGDTMNLKIEWEASKKRFNFFRDTDPVQRVTYVQNDATPAYFTFRQIGTRTSVANCMSGPRTSAYIDAKFDGVQVNASAIVP